MILLKTFFIFLFLNTSVTGTVKYYNEKSGFGYIQAASEEYYTYEENLIDEIQKGDKVSFKVRDTRKGLEAYEVKILNSKKQ